MIRLLFSSRFLDHKQIILGHLSLESYSRISTSLSVPSNRVSQGSTQKLIYRNQCSDDSFGLGRSWLVLVIFFKVGKCSKFLWEGLNFLFHDRRIWRKIQGTSLCHLPSSFSTTPSQKGRKKTREKLLCSISTNVCVVTHPCDTKTNPFPPPKCRNPPFTPDNTLKTSLTRIFVYPSQ
jgi:hypothetical protein